MILFPQKAWKKVRPISAGATIPNSQWKKNSGFPALSRSSTSSSPASSDRSSYLYGWYNVGHVYIPVNSWLNLLEVSDPKSHSKCDPSHQRQEDKRQCQLQTTKYLITNTDECNVHVLYMQCNVPIYYTRSGSVYYNLWCKLLRTRFSHIFQYKIHALITKRFRKHVVYISNNNLVTLNTQVTITLLSVLRAQLNLTSETVQWTHTYKAMVYIHEKPPYGVPF